MKKLAILFILPIIFLMIGIKEDKVDAETTFPDEGRGSVIRCLSDGNMDYIAFLDKVIANQSWLLPILDSFTDILYRNECQRVDIMMLINDKNRVLNSIRGAYLSCSLENLDDLIKRHNELLFEIEFVRKSVDNPMMIGLPGNIDIKLGSINATLLDEVYEATIYEEMYDKYVFRRDAFEDLQFNLLFNDLMIKYEYKIETYINCPSGTWQDVAKKWEEFIAFFTEDFGGLKGAWDDITTEAGQIAQDAQDFDFNFIQLNIQGLSAKEGFKEIWKDVKKGADFEAWRTQADFHQGISEAIHARDMENLLIDIKNNFDVKYREVDNSAMHLFIQTLDNPDKNPDGFVQILQSSIPEIENIAKGTGRINIKQCKN